MVFLRDDAIDGALLDLVEEGASSI